MTVGEGMGETKDVRMVDVDRGRDVCCDVTDGVISNGISNVSSITVEVVLGCGSSLEMFMVGVAAVAGSLDVMFMVGVAAVDDMFMVGVAAIAGPLDDMFMVGVAAIVGSGNDVISGLMTSLLKGMRISTLVGSCTIVIDGVDISDKGPSSTEEDVKSDSCRDCIGDGWINVTLVGGRIKVTFGDGWIKVDGWIKGEGCIEVVNTVEVTLGG